MHLNKPGSATNEHVGLQHSVIITDEVKTAGVPPPLPPTSPPPPSVPQNISPKGITFCFWLQKKLKLPSQHRLIRMLTTPLNDAEKLCRAFAAAEELFVRHVAVFEFHRAQEFFGFQHAVLFSFAEQRGRCPVDEIALTLLYFQRLALWDRRKSLSDESINIYLSDRLICWSTDFVNRLESIDWKQYINDWNHWCIVS